MKLVNFVLKHPYTVAAGVILVCILGIGAAMRMPIDIFPEINIPVVSVVWTYNGMSAQDIQNRILSLHERHDGLVGRRHRAHRGNELHRRRCRKGLSAGGRRRQPRGLAAGHRARSSC
jgi:hypothetical protein